MVQRAASLALVLACVLPTAAASRPPTVVAVGDIACDPSDPAFHGGDGDDAECRMRATSEQALALPADAVLLLGDNQYWEGTLEQYLASYHPTWGRLRDRTLPSPGNHEYLTPGAAGYFAYFGTAAGDPGQGWHARDLGSWRALALNSNCAQVGGCGAGSPQLAWLRTELAAHRARCKLAFWHHPRFSSGLHGDDPRMLAAWEALHAAGTDLVLVGHDHHYERFAPQDAAGDADPSGPRQLVVGTGGSRLYPIGEPRPNSERRIAGAYGVLALSLHPDGYSFRFLPLDGGPGDAGAALCHAAWPAATTYHPVVPCRAIATRRAAGPSGGPALGGSASRDFPIAGSCGVPLDAVAVLGELRAVAASSRGWLSVYPAGGTPTGTATLGFWKHGVYASPLLTLLGSGGRITVDSTVGGRGRGTVHLILDVFGYFLPAS